jgi:hypothetical protein
MTALIPGDLLARWPGRFRFDGLLVAFGTDATPTAADCAAALLRGAVCGYDAEGAVRALLDDGRFAVAERAMVECPDFNDDQVDELRGLLVRERARARQEVANRSAQIATTAELAEVESQLHRPRVESLVEDDRNAALALIEAEERRLTALVREGAAQLREELESIPDTGAAWSRVSSALIDGGNLRAARRVLRSRKAGRLGPAAVDDASDWYWNEPAAEVLSWYTSRSRGRPPSFAAWAATSTEAVETAQAMHELAGGSSSAAGRLARALEAFVHNSASRPAGDVAGITPVGDGWLAEVRGVFDDSEVTPVETNAVVDLYIAPPGQTVVPAWLCDSLSTPFLAVGPDLAREDTTVRSNLAVITLQDLLLLIRQDTYRRARLLRLAGPQWPLSALSAGSAPEISRLFDAAGPSEEYRWIALSWVLDLAGLRDAWLADALAFQTGLVPALIDVFLQHLTQVQPVVTRSNRRRLVTAWPDEPQLAAAVERAVLEPFDWPEAAMAFWAALAEGSPIGSAAAEEDVLVRAELTADEAVPLVEDGLQTLTRSPLIERPEPGVLRLRPCGVMIALTGQADQRLDASVKASLLRQQSTTETEAATSRAQLRWEAFRHALCPGYKRAIALIEDGSNSEAAQAAHDLIDDGELLVISDVPVVGTCDLANVLDNLCARFQARKGSVKLTADPTRPCPMPYRQEVLEAISWELIDSAEQRLRGRPEGRIWVTTRPAGEDLEIDVRDDGPALAIPHGREHRLWRSNPGLTRARQLAHRCDGDLQLVAAQGEHPTYPGAHFRLMLPM